MTKMKQIDPLTPMTMRTKDKTPMNMCELRLLFLRKPLLSMVIPWSEIKLKLLDGLVHYWIDVIRA